MSEIERVEQEFGADLVAALRDLPNPMTDQKADVPTKTGGRYSYRYASLPAILDVVRPILGGHRLALLQSVEQSAPGTVGVVTRLQHESGAFIEFGPLVLPAAGDAQSVGGAITYARRYALCAVLGIAADEDADGRVKNANVLGEARPGASSGADRSTATGGTVEQEGRSGGSEVGGETPREGTSEPSDQASDEQWSRAAHVGLRSTDVLRELQQAGIDVKKKSEVTSEQIEDVLRPFG